MTSQETLAPIYKLKISIDHAPYPLWRRIIVRGDTTLEKLHYMIQHIMGFENYHLWCFQTVFGDFSMDEEISEGFIPSLQEEDDEDEDTFHRQLANQVRLMDVAELKRRFKYVYDFGDDWVHTILVEDIAYTFPKIDKEPPYCLGGKGGSPIEDCGGVWGLEDTVAAWREIQELKKNGTELTEEEIEEKYSDVMLPYDESWDPKGKYPPHPL